MVPLKDESVMVVALTASPTKPPWHPWSPVMVTEPETCTLSMVVASAERINPAVE